MKITTAITEIICLSRHTVQCSFQTNGNSGVTFSNGGRQGNELNTRIGKASAVMRLLCRSAVLKRELCTKAKLFVFRSVFVPIFTYGHECWVVTERVRSRVQVAEMGFLRKVRGLSLLDKSKSSDIRQSLNIEPLLLGIEELQLCWYDHVTRMPPKR